MLVDGANGIWSKMMIYRGDIRFSLFIYWIRYLEDRILRLGKRGALKPRETRYLARAIQMYPPEPGDTCMESAVRRCLELSAYAFLYP